MTTTATTTEEEEDGEEENNEEERSGATTLRGELMQQQEEAARRREMVFRADSAAGQAAMSGGAPPFEPVPTEVPEPGLPVGSMDYVIEPPRPAPATTTGGAAENAAAYTGGPAYQAPFLSPVALGGPGAATAAPFYSGSEGYTSAGAAASTQAVLDAHTGAGTLRLAKQPMAPLFAPAADLSYVYGTPNQVDAIREREYVSMKQHGVRPGPQLTEGRGLTLDRSAAAMAAEHAGAADAFGRVDYRPEGTYVDALAARDLYADRGVDALRTANNPKNAEYFMAGFEGPAANMTMGSGRRLDDAPVPKNRPETFFENVLGLWRGPKSFRHTQSMEPEHFQAATQRQLMEEAEGGTGHLGCAFGVTGGVGSYVMETVREPVRRLDMADEVPFGQVDLVGAAPAARNDYSRYTQPVFENSRSDAPEQVYFGATFSSVLGQFVAPLAKALRPARRTAMAEAGNDSHGLGHFAGTGVGGFGSGTARSDGRALPVDYLLPTTIKEDTMLEDHFGQVSATEAQIGAHHDQNTRLRATEREGTTAHSGYLGAAQGLVPAEGLSGAQARPDRLREQTLIRGRAEQGCIGTFNPNAGSMGHRKPDAAAPARAPTASFVASVPSAATFGSVISRYEHAPLPPDEGAAPRKRRIVAANADDGAVGCRWVAAGSGGGGGNSCDATTKALARGGAATRAKHPSEHNFSSQMEQFAQIRERLQQGNPLVQNYRVA